MTESRELLLLRHGKSDWPAGVPDADRPLKNRGKRAAQRVGAWLARKGLIPDHVVTSPAQRARITAEKACKAMGLAVARIAVDSRVYEAEVRDLLGVLADCPRDARRVLLVGHNPGLEDLLTSLAPRPVGEPKDGKLLPTAAIARLSMPDDWTRLAAGAATLRSLTHPSDLPEWFPYPFPDGPEKRERPAYYYRQGAAIPYRRRRSRGIEVLVISSHKGKRWLVPKGVGEPGLSLAETASREALEEASVRGEVGEPLGRYRYPKWGAICSVEVYPFAVTRELAPPPERKRRWLDPAEAARTVEPPALGRLILRLARSLQAES